jgi:hypothetical protein
VPLLKPEANRGIQAAAMATSTTHTFAAVVTGKSLQVAAAPTGTTADLRPVRGLSGPPGQPAWAVTAAGAADAAIGLVTVRGRLYSFGSGSGARAEPVEWQNGDPGPLTAVSVAPDGHRVVVVSGGRLYRTVLTVGGDGVGGASPDPIWPATLTSVSAVAWSSEGWLTVAGVRASDNRVTIMDVSIDGAESHARLRDIGTQPVTALTAYPANPLTATGTRIHVSSAVSYVADAAAWDVLSEPVKITPADLAGPAATPPAGATPTAPFFLN